MYLQKDNLIIHDAQSADASFLCCWWNDGTVMEHAGFPQGIGTTVEKVKGEILQPDREKHRLILMENSTPIGEMCYHFIAKDTAEIGIKICEAQRQNHGLGPQFLWMLCHDLFEHHYCRRIILDTMLENKRAQHVYEKLGFVRAAVHENCWTDQTGQLRTAIDYELTADRLQMPFEMDDNIILIRDAQPEDLGKIMPLYRTLFETMAALQPEYILPAEQDPAFVSSVIAAPDQEVLLAEARGEAMGFALMMFEHTPPYNCFVPHPFTHLMDLVVSPAARSKGIGTLLLDATKNWARARGSDYVELCALSNNAGAIHLYERKEFCECMRTFRAAL